MRMLPARSWCPFHFRPGFISFRPTTASQRRALHCVCFYNVDRFREGNFAEETTFGRTLPLRTVRMLAARV